MAQVQVGHFLINFVKETCGFFQNVPTGHFGWVLFECEHNVTAGHKSDQNDGYFLKVITKYPLGKWGFAPSVYYYRSR